MTSSFRLATRAFLAFSLTLVAAALPLNRAAAQSMGQMQMPSFAQVALSDDDIRNFVDSFPKLKALGDKYGSRIDGGALAQNPSTALNVPPAALAELDAILSKYGFASVEQWQSIAYSTVLALAWRSTGQSPMQQLDRSIAEIRSNPHISQQQRDLIVAQMEAQRQLVAALEPLPENVERVAPYAGEIQAAIGE